METEPICPVCGASACGIDFVGTDFFVSGDEFPVLRCSACGFRMTGSAPGTESIGKYYQSEEYVSHSNTSRGLVNRTYHLVRRFMLGQKYQMVNRYSAAARGRLLDVGAGTGHFLHFMKGNQWEITGIEKSDQARAFALNTWGIPLLPENSLWSLQDHSFDAITLWHVLEHLHQPGKYLETFQRLIQPAGTLLIALPNPASFDAGYYKQHWAAWDVPRHLWHFAPDHIIRMAETYGFKLRKIRRMPFDAFYVSILSEKYRRSAFPIFRGLVVGTVSWLISLFSKKNCSSLVYIFRANN